MYSVNQIVVFLALLLCSGTWKYEVLAQFGDFVEQEIYDPPPSRYDNLGGYWGNSPYTREQLAQFVSEQFLQKHLPTRKRASEKNILQKLINNIKQDKES